MPRPRRIVPPRQWRIDSDEPLPTGRQALDQPFSAFPSWLNEGDVRPLRPGADIRGGARGATA